MKKVANILGYALCSLMLLGIIFLAAPEAKRVYAETAEALRAELEDILAQIAKVRAQFNLPSEEPAEGIPSVFRFSRTLVLGTRGIDVRYLQLLLNRDPDTRVNAPGLVGGAGAETDYFGAATRIAVGKFQNKYATDVLYPAGLSKGTGVVGPFTRNKLNAILLLSLQVAPVSTLPPAANAPVSSNVLVSATSSAEVLEFSFDVLNQKTRSALVNIVCTSKRGGAFNLISGSGVVVDPRGVVLTNAHLGQYFLLQDFPTPGNIECVVRAGEPARNKYKASLLFIPPAWVRDNASKILLDEPTGTGENDFVLLLIEETVNKDIPLPQTFSYIPIDFDKSSLREPMEVLVAAYPVGFLGGITIQKELYPSSSVVMTGTVYSFKENTPDIFSIGGSVVAQQGSSGGAVVNKEGNLIGLIVTSSSGKTTGERDLNALTMSHIDASFREHTGDGIRSLFVGDIRASAQSFNEKIAPELKKLLQDELTKR